MKKQLNYILICNPVKSKTRIDIGIFQRKQGKNTLFQYNVLFILFHFSLGPWWLNGLKVARRSQVHAYQSQTPHCLGSNPAQTDHGEKGCHYCKLAKGCWLLGALWFTQPS